jgi:hypothetical protein
MIRRALPIALVVGLSLMLPVAADQRSTVAAAPPPQALYAIVPFGEPGETDALLDDANEELSDALHTERVNAMVLPPSDPFAAVTNVRAICKREGATGMLVGTIRYSEDRSKLSPSLIPQVALFNATGALDSWNVKAQVRLRLIGCDGRMTWTSVALAHRTHHGTNVAASTGLVIRDALNNVAAQFGSRKPGG